MRRCHDCWNEIKRGSRCPTCATKNRIGQRWWRAHRLEVVTTAVPYCRDCGSVGHFASACHDPGTATNGGER